MIIIKSIRGILVRLTNERWGHITRRHPEMDNQKQKVLETIENPDLVQRGDFGEVLAIRYYEDTPLTSKHLVVAYKEIGEIDGFVITAYFTSRPSERREELWSK
jgi:hypothetical protein